MGEKARTALKWIAGILNDRRIPYRVGGGTAVFLYGSDRTVNDIDISISGRYFSELLPVVKEYITSGPKHYKSEKWDCDTLSLNYNGQDIDLTDADTLLMSKKDGSGWIRNKEIYGKYSDVDLKFEGVRISLMNPRALLEYKRELDGPHQESDRVFLEKYLQSKSL